MNLRVSPTQLHRVEEKQDHHQDTSVQFHLLAVLHWEIMCCLRSALDRLPGNANPIAKQGPVCFVHILCMKAENNNRSYPELFCNELDFLQSAPVHLVRLPLVLPVPVSGCVAQSGPAILKDFFGVIKPIDGGCRTRSWERKPRRQERTPEVKQVEAARKTATGGLSQLSFSFALYKLQ